MWKTECAKCAKYLLQSSMPVLKNDVIKSLILPCLPERHQQTKLLFTGKISQNPWVEKMCIPIIYFPWIGKKYSHTLRNLWKLISHIWELCGFFNSTGFYSNPIVWEFSVPIPHHKSHLSHIFFYAIMKDN